MSRYEYELSKTYEPDFYALIMAAMRQADTFNAAKLRAAFPETWAELDARYHAPGGVLEGDPVSA